MTSKNNRAPLLYYIKLCVSFQIHRWIQTEVTLRKRSIWVEIGHFLSLVTLKFDGWPWTIGHLFITTSSFVHHFKSIGELKLKLQSGNAQLGSKSAIFFVLCDLEIWWMTLENNRAPLLYYTKLCASFQIHRWIQIGVTVRKRSIWVKIDNFFVPCDLEIWWMTLENKRAPLLYYTKLCASSQIHRWIQIGVTVRKRPIWVKFNDFFSRVTLKFDRWPWKTIGHLFYGTSSFVHHFVAIGEFKLELQSGNTQSGSNPTSFWAVWPWNLPDDLEKQ